MKSTTYPRKPAPCKAHSDADASPVLNFPLLMDIEAEVARVEEAMSRAGYYWNDDARAWLRKPTFDEARDGMIAMGYSY